MQKKLQTRGLRPIVGRIPYRHADRFGESKAAMVVRRDVDFSIGTLLSHTAQTSDRTLRVFRDMEDAVAWLGVTLSVLDAEELRTLG